MLLPAEMAYGECDFRSELTVPAESERLVGGRLRLGARPGLGIALNGAVVEAHRAPIALPKACL